MKDGDPEYGTLGRTDRKGYYIPDPNEYHDFVPRDYGALCKHCEFGEYHAIHNHGTTR